MKIKNSNTMFSDKQIREIIKFVRPPGISNFDVMVKNSKVGYGGGCYHQGSKYHSTFKPFVVVRVGKLHFPYRETYIKGAYLPSIWFNPTEVLIHLLAHELRHLWQAKHPRGWRVYGARGQFSERDADAYAIQQVRKWRRK